MQSVNGTRFRVLVRRSLGCALIIASLVFGYAVDAGPKARRPKDKPPRAATPEPTPESDPGPAADSSIDLLVDRDGVYRVTYEALRDAGLDLASVDAGHLALANKGNGVPIHVDAGEGFGPGDHFEFFGEAQLGLYTDTNVYTLRVDPEAALRIDVVSARPLKKADLTPFYMETVTVDDNMTYDPASPGSEPWYHARLVSTGAPRTTTFPLQVDGLIAGAAPTTLSLVTWGGTTKSVYPDHHLVVIVNDLTVADESFDGLFSHLIDVQLPEGLLREGNNTLEMTLPCDYADVDVVGVEQYSVTYPRAFVARDGALTFSAAGEAFEVTGLPTENVVIYRRSVSRLERLEGFTVKGTPGAYSATVAGSQEAALYVVSSQEALPAPAIVMPRPSVDITSGEAQLLIIAHADFVAGVAPLAEARRAQGMTVRVVDVEDVYAQFGYGIFGPQAVQDYIAQAAQESGTEYVLLVGADSYDYHDYLGLGSRSFVPSLYGSTSSTIRFAPLDSLLADTDGDRVADLAIGRLPVRTAAELQVVVEKTMAYTHKDYGRTALFMADDWSPYSQASDSIDAGLPDGWDVEKGYLESLSIEEGRAVLRGALDRGVAVTNYVGKGGPTWWSYQQLLTASDVLAPAFAGRPTVMMQWACWSAHSALPSGTTLANSLLLKEDRGAAAVLGFSTVSDLALEMVLGELIAPEIVRPGMSIGRAMQHAREELMATRPDLRAGLPGWVLLGDPTLVVEP